MASFAYVRPASVAEAVAAIAEHGPEAKVLAGGQSLIPMMTLGLAEPAALIDIGHIPELDTIGTRHGRVAIGALVRHQTLASEGGPASAIPLLKELVPYIGNTAIRRRGTFVGSVAHGDPGAEWPALVLALDGEVEASSIRGQRLIPAEEFYLGPLTTSLEPDEIVTAVHLPIAPAGTGVAAIELAYRHGDYAIVGVAAQVTVSADDCISAARLGLFGVGPTPIRAGRVELALAGGRLEAIAEAASTAREDVDPATDATASAEYRRDMSEVLVRRAVMAAYQDALQSRDATLS